MKINKLTITGADDKVNQNDLAELSSKYPFVEWGILFSSSKIAKPRYPSIDWIAGLVDCNVPLSAHFCGWWSKQVLEEGNMDLINNLPEQFKRVQLNYNFASSKEFVNFVPILQYAGDNPERSIIFQYNKSNTNILNSLISLGLPKNIYFLYDSSAGRGSKIEEINDPIVGSYTGYSGGINDENIEFICQELTNNVHDVDTWIDLESGARTNDEFDLDKVNKILEIVKNFV